FCTDLTPAFAAFNKAATWQLVLWEEQKLGISVNPAKAIALAIGVLILVLLYRRITTLGRLTVVLWVGVLGIIAWVIVDGLLHFAPAKAFDFWGAAAGWPDDFAVGLGGAMLLAMYSYLGYYNICYVGDEVRDPGRTIPRAIILSAVLVCVLFVLV